MRRYLRRRVEAGVYIVCAVFGTWNLIKGAALWYVADRIERSRQPHAAPSPGPDF